MGTIFPYFQLDGKMLWVIQSLIFNAKFCKSVYCRSSTCTCWCYHGHELCLDVGLKFFLKYQHFFTLNKRSTIKWLTIVGRELSFLKYGGTFLSKKLFKEVTRAFKVIILWEGQATKEGGPILEIWGVGAFFRGIFYDKRAFCLLHPLNRFLNHFQQKHFFLN